MLLSMTGFGEARRQENGVAVAIELRTVNSRYFKLSLRASEPYGSLEPQIERAIRQQVRRGTVQVQLRADRQAGGDDYRLNGEVLDGYRQQLEEICDRWKLKTEISPASLLGLPGVVDEVSPARLDAAGQWPLVSGALDEALAGLARARSEEGAALTADLEAQCGTISRELDAIAARWPEVIDEHRGRLHERVSRFLEKHEVTVEPQDLVREVSLVAERSDISEEIVRLRSHLEQFATVMKSEESAGRRLEFLTQEMFREANTIGSKSTDVEIARRVIEIKAAIERVREQVQNVE